MFQLPFSEIATNDPLCLWVEEEVACVHVMLLVENESVVNQIKSGYFCMNIGSCVSEKLKITYGDYAMKK